MAYGRAEVGGVLVEILPTTDRARVQVGGVLVEILPTTDQARVHVGGVLVEITVPTDAQRLQGEQSTGRVGLQASLLKNRNRLKS
jgi:hypothetical protein